MISGRHLALALLSLCPPAAAEGVQLVRPGGALTFYEIQAAVDEALDGEVLLLAAGDYPGFTIDGKGLSVLAATGAVVQVAGTIEVLDVPAGSAVVLAGLRVEGVAEWPQSHPALRLDANAGDVRVQDCVILGGEGSIEGSKDPCYDSGDGGHGAELTDSPRTAFVACELRGGEGSSEAGMWSYKCWGGNGGDGLRATDSPTALYDCTLRGGDGGSNGTGGGHGGAGYRALGFGCFASGCELRGGGGGLAWDFVFVYPGDGGDGLVIEGTTARLLDTIPWGGPAGGALGPHEPAQPGVPVSGDGTVLTLPGDARRLRAEPTMSPDAQDFQLHVEGLPGDRVALVASTGTSFTFSPSLSGAWLASYPTFTALVPVGVVPASGVLDAPVRLRDLPTGVGAERQCLQGIVIDAGGTPWLASPVHLAVIDRASQPDCNGNGSIDFLDVIEGWSEDCLPDLVPDECQLITQDCNANGVPDRCDIEAGTSIDLNQNGVPDECEAVDQTWYVDASAPPGGDGSAAHPFRTLAEGIGIGLPGDTVIVADGLYVGPQNRGLSFSGRDLVLKSANGPLACVIDCEQQDRAFTFDGGESVASRVEGLTIRNGSTPRGGAIDITESSTTIADCVIEDCSAYGSRVYSGTYGGAVYMQDSNSVVLGCVFRRNRTIDDATSGGAIAALGGSPRIEDCTFVGNESVNHGGALVLAPGVGTPPCLVSHCRFIGNSAVSGGGAVQASGATSDKVFGNCLFIGNRATWGGAFAGSGNLFLLDCTLVANVATQRGGAVRRDSPGEANLIANCVLWGNSAPVGPAISIGGSSASLAVRYSDVQGGEAAVEVAFGATLDWQAGNQDVDPLFVDPDGADNDPLTYEDNDYRLGAASPCIDAGDDARIVPDLFDRDMDGNTGEPVPFDLDDLPRQADDPAVPDTGNGAAPIVDLGAFERQP